MKRACIAIVDATRARIYTCDRTADPAGAHAAFVGAPHEASDLVNRGGAAGDRRSRIAGGGAPDSCAGGAGVFPRGIDRPAVHAGEGEVEGEIDRRFARQVIDEIARISREQATGRVLLVATPAMLGELRGAMGALPRPELQIEYVARDLARLISPQLHDHFEQLRLVAPRRTSFLPG